MRRRLRIRCALFAVLMVWSAVLCAISVSAADAITVVTAAGVPGQRYLMTAENAVNPYGVPSPSYVYTASDGIFWVVTESAIRYELVAEKYSAGNFRRITTKTVPRELDKWLGFCAGDDCVYFVFGARSFDHHAPTEFLRIVRYDQNYNRLSEKRFFCGDEETETVGLRSSLRMEMCGDTLVLTTARLRYDGKFVSFTIGFDADSLEETFRQSSAVQPVNQFLAVTADGRLCVLEHAADTPRGLVLTVGEDAPVQIYEIPGAAGADCTGVSLGGFAVSDTAQMALAAMNTIGHPAAEDASAERYSDTTVPGPAQQERDAVLLAATLDGSGECRTVVLTDYAGTGLCAGIPQLVKLTDDCFLYQWETFRYVSDWEAVFAGYQYLFVDGSGTPLTAVETRQDVRMSDGCQPQVVDGDVVWYLSVGGEQREFYRLHPERHGHTEAAILTEAFAISHADCMTAGEIGGICRLCGTEVHMKTDVLRCAAAAFADVAVTDWFHAAADYALDSGIMNGTADDMFTPEAKISRAMIAQVLYNREGRPAISGGDNDGAWEPQAWYYDAMRWAYTEGLILRTSAESEITRGEIARILWRYAGCPDSTQRMDGFADAAALSGDTLMAMRWAVEAGVFRGDDRACLYPDRSAMRAEAAQIFMNLFRMPG